MKGIILIRRMLTYTAIARVAWRSRVAFAGSLVAQGLMVGLTVWIFKQLYAVTYASAQVTQVGGLTLSQVVWLLALVQIFERAAWPSPIRLIDEEIKSGSIIYALQRPYSYILYHGASFFGRAWPTFLMNLVFGVSAALLLVGGPSFTLKSIGLGVIILLFGYILDFMIFFSFGIMGFWVEEVKPFEWLYSKLKLILGGVLLPITLFPDFVKNIILLLPFANLYYSAAQLMVQFDNALFYRCILVQLGWMVILGGFVYYLFRKGVRHVVVNGG